MLECQLPVNMQNDVVCVDIVETTPYAKGYHYYYIYIDGEKHFGNSVQDTFACKSDVRNFLCGFFAGARSAFDDVIILERHWKIEWKGSADDNPLLKDIFTFYEFLEEKSCL